VSNYKYNLDLLVELEDFKSSGYEEVLESVKREDYYSYWSSLSNSARKGIEKGNDKKGKVLWLLAEVCSLMLKPSDLQAPYVPIAVWANGTRSVAVEDFIEADITFFENIVEECKNNMLQARIADLLWLLKTRKNIRHLEIAVENYMKFPMDNDISVRNTKECMERAIRLTILAKKPLQDIQNFLLKIFEESKFEDNFDCLDINELLLISKIDINQNLKVLEKLVLFGEESETKVGFWKARKYYQSVRTWYGKMSNYENVNRLTVNIAENFVKEAEHQKNLHMAAAKFYENAIQEYRLIPVKDRESFNVDKRIHEIYQLMAKSNQLVHTQMQVISSDPIDISQLVNIAESSIEGKSIHEALLNFVDITYTSDFDKLKQSSEKRLNSSLFSRLFGATYYSADSRVIAKTEGGLDSSGEAYETQLEAQIQREYSIDIELSTKGSIFPAFDQLLLEHTISRDYIQSICLNSSIVPRDRAIIWAEGLYFGFEENFLVSTHLLIPQVEHLIRVILKQNDIKTTVLEPSGIEIEKGLSTLIEEPILEEVLDKNLVYELKFLLTKAIGYNLRNNVAHGLSSRNIFNSIQAVYLWWFILRLVVRNSPLKEVVEKEKGSSTPE
jgi:hypothetical protein